MSCNKSAVRLRTILRNLQLDKDTPSVNSYLSTIRPWGSESRAEVLVKEMLEAVLPLVEGQTGTVLVQEQLRQLSASLEELLLVGPLVGDPEEPVGSFPKPLNEKFALPFLPRGSPYPERLDSSSLRLLEIVSADDDNIGIRLQPFKFDRGLSFEALSYVWGTEGRIVPITCNQDTTVLVTPSLKKTLKSLHLYRPPPARPLWIDAICKSQDDDKEKAAHIPLMTDIYSRAAQTIIWSGPSDMADTFMDVAPAVARRMKSGYALEDIQQCIRGSGLRVLQSPEEVCDGRLGPYFGRHLAATWAEIFAYRHYKSKEGTLDLKMIPGLLSEGMLRAVRDPVDRIWAVAGLFEGSFRHQIMQHIDLGPKARQEYWSTYINFTKELLLWVPSLGILSIPPSPERDPRLPKWCPDFSKWPTHDGMYTFSTTSVQVSPDWEIQTILPVVDGLGPLGLTNGSQAESQDEIERWENTCLSLSRRVTNENDGIPRGYIRTLLGGRYPFGYEEHGSELWERAHEYALRGVRTPSRGIGGFDWSPPKARLLQAFHRFRSRSFFSTRDGRLGRGPPSLKPGDTVCCFHSAAPLFILRFSDKGNGVAQFVGDAFVHGCMDFDSLETPQKNNPEDFSIE
ncbi:hypothetical protein MRS44_004098 [Fusarium solani]|uniref:uncharacterized protein n=1 Tax=Fusarium solani TaxID=169388 RepID=UPI0032C45BF0|nr:hypothetical protein MRS44_004098 [Fusarium solani]